MIWIKNAKYIGNFKIKVEFSDNSTFEIDLNGYLSGGLLDSLNDVSLFSKLRFDPELETIVWENGADLSPEFLYELGKKQQGEKVGQ